MSDFGRQRLIRAVRLLPSSVKVGHGTLEESDGGAITEEGFSPESQPDPQQTALAVAESETRMLRSELRSREEELAELRGQIKANHAQIERLKVDYDRQIAEFQEQVRAEDEQRRAEAASLGHKEGYDKGYGEGLKKAETEINADYQNRFDGALGLLGSIHDSLTATREELSLGHLPQMMRIWQMMLEKLLQAHVELEPELVKKVLEHILKRVSDREKILVYLNPSDISVIESSKDQILDSIRGVKYFELLSDEYVEKGSCLIETNLGIYDARWKTQLEQISGEVEKLILESMIKNDDTDNGDGEQQSL